MSGGSGLKVWNTLILLNDLIILSRYQVLIFLRFEMLITFFFFCCLFLFLLPGVNLFASIYYYLTIRIEVRRFEVPLNDLIIFSGFQVLISFSFQEIELTNFNYFDNL